MVAQSEVMKGVTHAGVAGSLRETFVRTVIQPLLPAGGAATTGVIVDSQGGQSGQIDVIVYSRSLMPPLYEGEPSLIPVESALYAIEVKTRLTRTEVDAAVRSAQTVSLLASMQSNARPVPVLFAFGSNLSGKGKTELDRLIEASSTDPPYIRVIVVVGGGYWYYNEGEAQWMHSPPSPEYGETVDFLGGFVNSLQQRPLERLGLFWGNYVVRLDAMAPVTRSSEPAP
jgi:hypothetical protein